MGWRVAMVVEAIALTQNVNLLCYRCIVEPYGASMSSKHEVELQANRQRQFISHSDLPITRIRLPSRYLELSPYLDVRNRFIAVNASFNFLPLMRSSTKRKMETPFMGPINKADVNINGIARIFTAAHISSHAVCLHKEDSSQLHIKQLVLLAIYNTRIGIDRFWELCPRYIGIALKI